MRPRVQIEVHRHGRDKGDDITSAVTRLEWSRSLVSPWQSLTVTWKATVGDSISRVIDGDWIVLRVISAAAGGRGEVAALCHVDSTSGGLAVGQMGQVYTQPCVASCTSWWNLLTNVNIYSPYGWVNDVGTLFSLGTWSNLVASISADYSLGSLGEAFKKIFKAIAAIELPESLVGGKKGVTLGQVIPVVHDNATREVYANTLTVESIDIGGGPPSRLSPYMQSYEASASDILTGAFVPEAMLVELFPSFEPTVALQTADTPPAADRSIETEEYLRDFLGGWESLVLRMKPFRTKPLSESAVAWASYQHVDEESRLADDLKAAFPGASSAAIDRLAAANAATSSYQIAQSMRQLDSDLVTMRTNAATAGLLNNYFQEVTWDYSTAKNIPSSFVRSFTWQRTDRGRLNCSSIALSVDASNGVEGLVSAGLPITYDTEIKRHGLRLVKPQWTFTVPDQTNNTPAGSDTGSPPKTNTSATTDFVAYMRTVCAQLMQFYKNNHLYMNGSLSLNLTEAVRSADNSTVFDKVISIRPGEVVAVSFSREVDTFFAYVETIAHVYEVKDGGIETASTNVTYSRGHFGVSKDALADEVKVPLRTASASSSSNPSTQTPPTSPTPPGQSPSAVASGPATFPEQMPDIFPVHGLREWGVSRGFRSKWYDTGFVPVPGMYDPANTWKRTYVITAAAYVIESYWAHQYPGAKIVVLSHGRATFKGDASQNHTSGSAIDFAIDISLANSSARAALASVYPTYNTSLPSIRVPVLQTWACLKRLAASNRIPVGGRGLYLNLSNTGLTGTAWHQANKPSKPGAPPGASAGVHYDFRGTFGRIFKPKPPPSSSTLSSERIPILKYVRADTTNDGSDDFDETTTPPLLILGTDSTHPSTTGVWDGPALRAYYNTEGANDSTLHAVASTVPNIMQLLGLQEPKILGV